MDPYGRRTDYNGQRTESVVCLVAESDLSLSRLGRGANTALLFYCT